MFRPAYDALVNALAFKRWYKYRALRVGLGVALCFLVQFANADHLGTVTGKVLLTVSGNVAEHEHSTQYSFDLPMLESLAETSVVTNNPWTDGPTKYSGIRISLLLDAVGAKSTSLAAYAFDDYSFTLSTVDFDKYPVIIAYKKNDEPMTIRSLGPLWIIFPFDDYPELLTESNKAASVWQLERIVVN